MYFWQILWLVLAYTLSFPAMATDDPLAPTDTDISLATVEIDGQALFKVRGLSAFPASQRAKDVENRITDLARTPDFRPDTLSIAEAEFSTDIMAGNRLIMKVYDADGRIEQVRRQTLASANLERIKRAVEDFRHDRRPDVLHATALFALSVLTASIAGLWALIRLRRWLNGWMTRRLDRQIQSLGVQSFEIIRAEHIWGALRGGLNGATGLASMLLLLFSLHYVLVGFPWTRGLGNALLDAVADPFQSTADELIHTLPDLAFLAILSALAYYGLKLLRFFFDAVGQGTVTFDGFHPEWAEPSYKIARTLVIAFTLIVAYPNIPGSESTAFKGVSIFLGLIFSLGSSSVIANTIAGYSLIYRRAFRLGDRVKIGDLIGDVIEMRMQVTHLQSPKNEEIVVPNSLILNSQVVNYSSLAKSRGLILHTVVGIGYETPWRQVEAMLLMAADRTAGLLKEPAPFVLQQSLGDFAVNYELNVYCADASAMFGLYAALHRNIQDVFNEYGVQIMTPAYESDPEQPKLVPKQQWFMAPARSDVSN